jgi:hypothetical protein
MRYLVFLLLFVVGCKTDNITPEVDKEFVKTVKKLEGTVTFNGSDYSINVMGENNDYLDIGEVLNMPEEFKTSGLEVQFDGHYYKFDGGYVICGTVPINQYYLYVTKISKVN